MKRLNFIMAACLIFSVAACDNEGLIVDWAPVSICITAADSYGNDMLDPQGNSSIVDGTTLTFRNKTYEVGYELINHYEGAKAYMPTMNGLQLDTVRLSGKLQYCLWFGEIDGGADMNEDLVISWGNGTTDVINYHCYKHNERKLSCKREWKVNGKSVDDGSRIFAFEKSFQ